METSIAENTGDSIPKSQLDIYNLGFLALC